MGDTGKYHRIIFVLISFALSLTSIMRYMHFVKYAMHASFLLFMIYGCYALVTAAYLPEHSMYSMWKSGEIVADSLCMIALLASPNYLRNVHTAYTLVIALFAILVVIYIVEAITMPSLAFTPVPGTVPFIMHGVMPIKNPNTLGFMSAVVIFTGCCRFWRGSVRAASICTAIIVIFAVVILVLAQSRTSIIALSAAFIVYSLIQKKFKSLLFSSAVLACVFAFSTSGTVTVTDYMQRGQSTELMMSLSGRTQGWEAAWGIFLQSPWLGHGFVAFARTEILGTRGASTLHGSVFDVLVGVGLIGFVPWLGAILAIGISLARSPEARGLWSRLNPRSNFRAELLGVFVMLLVRATTSSALAIHEHEFMLLLAVGGCTAAIRLELRRERERHAL
jgi:O-antigen ligase